VDMAAIICNVSVTGAEHPDWLNSSTMEKGCIEVEPESVS
jgi:hypothetical protein